MVETSSSSAHRGDGSEMVVDTSQPSAVGVRAMQSRLVGLPLGSVILQTARAALGLTAQDVAHAAGCAVALVEEIESGEHDPVLDTVQRMVASVGLDLRGGTRRVAHPAYGQVHATEVRRLSSSWAEACADRAAVDAGPPGPMMALQLPWDGQPPAPPHLIGAGPTRRTGGGWAAILVRQFRSHLQMGTAEFARAADLTVTTLASIEAGKTRPPVSQVQRLHTALGRALSMWVEVYDDHDDGLELDYIRDPAGTIAAVYEIRDAVQRGMAIRRSRPGADSVALGP